jgi:hypothetical protein
MIDAGCNRDTKGKMKLITAFHTGRFRVIDGITATPAPPEEILKPWAENRSAVIEGAISVEEVINEIILDYFTGIDSEKRKLFESLILHSDWCSFSSKRKLITHIIEDRKLLETKQKEHCEKLMRAVMSYRNAFTHGHIWYDAPKYWLSYFEGSPQRRELSDEYLEKVETTLEDARQMLEKMALAFGAIGSPPAAPLARVESGAKVP